MTAQDAFDEWMAHDEWQFADREACWKFMFEKGKESMRQQLASALAACKLKDEELDKIIGHIGLYNLFSCVGSDSYDPECADLNVGKCGEIATKALAIQPDDSAIKAWLGEPADWKFTTSSGTYYTDDKRDWLDGYGIESVTPLYSPKGLK
jgi:hypothetical protein